MKSVTTRQLHLCELILEDVVAKIRRVELRVETRANHRHDVIDATQPALIRQQVPAKHTINLHNSYSCVTRVALEQRYSAILSAKWRKFSCPCTENNVSKVEKDGQDEVFEIGGVAARHELHRLLDVLALDAHDGVAGERQNHLPHRHQVFLLKRQKSA